MKKKTQLTLHISLFLFSTITMAQELYLASDAAAALNETNSVGNVSNIRGIGCTTGVETTVVAVGTYSYKGTSIDGANDRIQITPTLTNGLDYEMKVYLAEGAGADINVHVWEGVTMTTPTITPSISTASSSLQEFTISFTTTSSTPILRFYNRGATGTTIYLDNVSIVQLGVDTQAPSTPTNLLSSGNTDTTADLSWDSATDNTGVTNYKVFKDGNLEATLGNVTTYQVTGLAASTTYSFTISALDAANNESTPSTAVSVTTDSASGGGGSGSSVWSEAGSVASYMGNVAIGTSSVPSGYRLAVDGHIRTREIRVDQDTWPDYVFKEGYDLPSLEEIQKHIKEKGHLPNIPSAKEVETNGIELGQMDKLLLEKIEELTLYILKQEAKSNLQSKTLQQQNHKIKILEKKIANLIEKTK
ncbi:fibronectin type III domain-containing protein [Flagellimonas pacifica]|uniref:Fibronectin type III domain-containing protein n=1 Tax=Flagellimonas pacifica TaxID=1247520 RepID=A0A285MAD4_9FLAO|nr:fibronectin type III domain-containing protein [Allomuricauda parva]SNY94110.1 Fibronectin type III domain-containing protein [Allomuricauda parva]